MNRALVSERPASLRQAGFTLLELMLALALLAILLVLLFGAFHAVAKTKMAAEARIQSDEEGRALIWMLSRELRGAVYTPMIPSHVLLIGHAVNQGGSAMDNLTIATLTPGHQRALTGFSSENLVTYTAVPNPNHHGWYQLMRAQQSALLPVSGTAVTPPVVMASNVVSLHLRYFNGGQWLESWDSTVLPPGQALPQAVEIDLELGSTGRPSKLSTMVTIPMSIVQR